MLTTLNETKTADWEYIINNKIQRCAEDETLKAFVSSLLRFVHCTIIIKIIIINNIYFTRR